MVTGDRLQGWIRANLAPIAELVTGGHRREVAASSRVEANARLTATIGLTLIVLLAAEGVTILAIHHFLALHEAIGILLIPPILLKVGSTLRRFLGYYSGARDFRAAGPPPLLLRLVGPGAVLLTALVLGTGIELWLFGLRFGSIWLTAHKATFVLWLGVMGIHVVGHLERAPLLALRDQTGPPLPGRGQRRAWLAASLLVGAVLALGVLVYSSPFIFPLESG